MGIRKLGVCIAPWQGVVAFGAMVLGSCSGASLVRPHTPLSALAEPLRSDFNRDKEAVRIIVLASPT